MAVPLLKFVNVEAFSITLQNISQSAECTCPAGLPTLSQDRQARQTHVFGGPAYPALRRRLVWAIQPHVQAVALACPRLVHVARIPAPWRREESSRRQGVHSSICGQASRGRQSECLPPATPSRARRGTRRARRSCSATVPHWPSAAASRKPGPRGARRRGAQRSTPYTICNRDGLLWRAGRLEAWKPPPPSPGPLCCRTSPRTPSPSRPCRPRRHGGTAARRHRRGGSARQTDGPDVARGARPRRR